ncbi:MULTISPECIES: diguanylate cyclase [Actinomycetes]|uniref:sensor domain-containing protein n=1 Tax=Actinomycetes TaxID=1760 RepID=UPI0018CC2558|nr:MULTISPECIES: diguanylate cyclase [Actinomycetes]
MSDNNTDVSTGQAIVAVEDASEQRALREHEHYQSLVEHNPHPIAVHSGGVIVYVNRAAIVEIGATRLDDLVGCPITDVMHPDSIREITTKLVSLTTDGDFTDAVEVRMVRFDGSVIDMEIVSVLTKWRGALAYQVIFRDLTATKAAEQAIRHQVALVATVSDAIIATDAAGKVVSWNPAAQAIYGSTAVEAIGCPVAEVLGAPVNLRRRVGKPAESVVHYAKDGAPRMMRLAVSEMDGGYVVVCSDNTAQIEAETKFTSVVNSLQEGVLLISQDGVIESANPAARRMFESEQRRAVGSSAERITIVDLNGIPIPPQNWPSQVVAATHEPVIDVVIGFDRLDGSRVWLSCNGFVLSPNDPDHSSVVISFTDVTESRARAARLEYAADHDMMTDLPNRSYVLRRLTTMLENRAAQQDSGDIDVVMYIDLDKLKNVNDSHGHRAGDRALIAVSRRLRAALSAPHFVGRVGGDEFVAVLIGVDEEDMEDISDDIHLLLLDPIEINGEEFRMRTSVGIVRIRDGENRTAQDIISDADTAMYQAKLRGGGHTVEHDKAHPSREFTPAAIKLVR